MKIRKLILAFSIFSFTFSSGAQSIQDSLRKKFFDISRYQLTDQFEYEDTPQLAVLPSDVPKMMMRVHWTFEGGPQTCYDILFPEFKGSLESRFFNRIDTDLYFDVEKFLKSYSEGKTESGSQPSEKPEEISENSDKDDVSGAIQIQETLEKESSILNVHEGLSIYSFSDEFITVQDKDSSKIIINADNEKSVRIFYDDKTRVSSRETWSTSDLNSSVLLKIEFFLYEEDGTKPKSCIIYEAAKKSEILYDENGKLIKQTNYVPVFLLKKSDGEKKSNENLILKNNQYAVTEIYFTKYNEDGKISEKISEIRTFTEEFSRNNYSKTIKKEKFDYKIENGRPDYYYYEDGKLKSSTIYSSSSDYISTTYFDEGFSIESYFVLGIHTKDIFYSRNLKIREQSYE